MRALPHQMKALSDARPSDMATSSRKSRERTFHSNNLGEYMLLDVQHNVPILGWNYDASLEDIADFLSDEPVTA